jgi:SpoVK/Ycf46/Vps4 family AAA+-type ATPase
MSLSSTLLVLINPTRAIALFRTNVASRIRYVFARLQSLQDCVILFDEIEEFCLDRESPGLVSSYYQAISRCHVFVLTHQSYLSQGMESRMLTTAMLTAINDLRRAKKSIFFLATNRLRAFDSAIIRPGRFDMQLFVGTPNLSARTMLFRSQLASVPVAQDAKDEAEKSLTSFLSSVWEEDIMFFNYLESLQFASACADVVAKGNELTEDTMATILKAQTKVMTVRGAVREEFVASMGLSRL